MQHVTAGILSLLVVASVAIAVALAALALRGVDTRFGGEGELGLLLLLL